MDENTLLLPPLTNSDIEEFFGDTHLLSGLSQETDLPDLEDLKQTGFSVDTIPYPGQYNFHVDIEESGSKLYTFSKELNRLYCNMDRAVPIILKFDGTVDKDVSHIRAMLTFKEPDHLKSPVYRCRTHTDETYGNNQGCKHYKHVVRCDNDLTYYKEDVNSHRHSVLTRLGSNLNGHNGIKAMYRFMCSTTCNGVGAIARRRTFLVFTLEDASYRVIGRAVLKVKICSCPVRDKRRDEEGSKEFQKDGDTKKRKSSVADSGTKKKKEIMISPSPIGTGTPNGGTNPLCPVKTENEAEGVGEYLDLQITIPQFPTSKLPEFESFLRRGIASFYVPDEDINNITAGVQINTL